MGLKDVVSFLPPGFRFHPSDEELVEHYLYKKVANEKAPQGTMVEVDLHTREPWELPEVAMLTANEWYFFSFRDRKYATGSRANRATKSGYWKATGKDRTVYSPKKYVMIGMRKTLVFYLGRAPNGVKTNWIMHEFRLETPHSPPKENWVLCRVFHKRKREEDKESSSTPASLWDTVPYTNEEVNRCSFSGIIACEEEDNNNNNNNSSQNYIQNTSLMQNILHDFTCGGQVEMGLGSGDNERYESLWDVELDHGNETVSLEELGFGYDFN